MSLRDALARKKRRETHYDIVLISSDEQDALEERFTDCKRRLALAEIRNATDSDDAEAARTELEEVRDALRGATHRVRFQSLPPDEYEALVSAHPPTKEQQAAKEVWDEQTFAPALIAACAVDSDMTAEDWKAELASGRWSTSDKATLFIQALEANVVPRSVTVPKG